MFHLHYELSVLSRSVAYTNLSAASLHVGLSQPQLSRIVSKLESNLKLTLLDREARRKSGWTPSAFQLSALYSKLMHSLEKELEGLLETTEPKHMRIGTLEGMISVALPFCHQLLKTTSIQILELDIHDLNRLEEGFFNGTYSLIFSLREPGRKKYKYSKEIGFQEMEKIEKGKNTQVLSTFEYGAQLEKSRNLKNQKLFVTNSLNVRKLWLTEFEGEGLLPSKIYAQKPSASAKPVYLVAGDQLPPMLWGKIKTIKA